MKKLFALLISSFALFACASDQTDENAEPAEAGLAPAPTEAPIPETEETIATAMVPSIIFVQYLNQQAPTLLCQQDPGIACLNMPTDLCTASVQSSIERCGPKLLEEWPESFAENEANAIKYSQSYRNCVLRDWVVEFGLQEERLDACGIRF